ncbi:hypothetical protein [Occallatibacter riparius]|uniref:Glycerophosphoryl diester phosphodiesterase membrane domain-containing protein n=1 Tax=Occallatibacter riparius TaxID=1002689 RepID=A0A9J7BN25_9BACT|nr:hypothetical protein [Occallatibacter riparius]UWZ84292.1 hypothetical protein MOP44_27565 [Occallatibacter riparius]
MNQPLRPMRLGELLDRAIQLLRTNLGLFFGIALPPAIAQFAMSTAGDFFRADGRGIGYAISGLTVIVLLLGNLIITPVATAAQCWATSQLSLSRAATVRSAYGSFSNRKASLVGLAIMQGLMSFWPVVILYFVATALLSALHSKGGVAFAVIIVALCAIPCGLVWARYLLAFPATAILRTPAGPSIDRSVTLGDGYRWKVMWAGLLPLGILWALKGSGDWLIGLLNAWGPFARHSDFLAPFLVNFWNLLVDLVFMPLEFIALTLVYYDLCVRKEGLDIALMMEQAGMETIAEPAALTSAGEEPA